MGGITGEFHIGEQVWMGNNFTLSTGLAQDNHPPEDEHRGYGNGILQIGWMIFSRINASNGKFKLGDTYGVTAFQMTPVWGGGAVPSTQYMWFDDVIVQTTPFGTSSTTTLQPAPLSS
jgi:hypothetical protein